MEKQNRIRAYKGDPVNPGVSRKTAGINFAVEIPCGISASLVLYRKGAALPEVEIPFTEEHRTGRMCAILISGLKPDKYEYNFRAAGKIMQDPFARVIRGREKFGAPVSEDESCCTAVGSFRKKSMTGRKILHRKSHIMK